MTLEINQKAKQNQSQPPYRIPEHERKNILATRPQCDIKMVSHTPSYEREKNRNPVPTRDAPNRRT
jgi:hypothetical protein